MGPRDQPLLSVVASQNLDAGTRGIEYWELCVCVFSDVGQEVSTFDSSVANIRHVFAVRTVSILGHRCASYWEGDGNNS